MEFVLIGSMERRPGQLVMNMMMLSFLISLASMTYAEEAGSCVFEGAVIHNQNGKRVGCEDLRGKTVALYFAGE